MDGKKDIFKNPGALQSKSEGDVRKGFFSKATETAKHFAKEKFKTKEFAVKYIYPVASFAFALLCSEASPALGCTPFGIASVCSTANLPCAVGALVGSLIGTVGKGTFGIMRAVIFAGAFFARAFIGSCGIVKTGVRVYGGTSFETAGKGDAYSKLNDAFSSSIGANAVVALAASCAVGVFGIITGGNLWYDVFSAFLGIMLIPVFTIAFSSVGTKGISPVVCKAGVGSIAYALVLSVSDFQIGGMSVAVCVAMIFTMWSAWSLGLSDGVLFGFFCGIALEPSLAATYAVSAALLAALSGFSLGVGCFGAACAAASWALYSDGISALSKVIPEIILATALFYPAAYFKVLPSGISFVSEESVGREVGESDASEKLRRISDAMGHMANVFSSLSKKLCIPDGAEIMTACEKGFSAYCGECGKSEICHHREDFKRGSVIKKAASYLREYGKVGVDSFSDSMARGCPNLDGITECINSEYAKAFENASKTDKTSAFAQDYATMSKLIREAVCASDTESSKNDRMTERLACEFEKNKIGCESIGVYGVMRPRIYIRGFDVRDLTCGASDIREIAENALKIALCEPETSIDYDKLNMFMESRKRFEITYGTYSESACKYEANGDRAVSFKGDDESFYALVCDGMGSGREAALTSGVCCVFLEKMISAGCPVPSALMLLNNFTRERRIECSSSVDLLKIDPYSATASFIKSGAAPSFVLRDNKLFRINSDTPPVGILKKPFAKETKMKLRAGDRIIMMSDGAIPDGEGEAWLYDALTSPALVGKDLNAGAKKTAEEAMKRRVIPDDCTVCVISLSELSA